MDATASERPNWLRKRPIRSKAPTKLTEKQFIEPIAPYLSQAKRRFISQNPRYKMKSVNLARSRMLKMLTAIFLNFPLFLREKSK